ncbi:para-nitrobenzyl esterase [Dietzia kunjamensis subsp. schimae]|uniref:Carboxylic ester hydrolase n=1 Tax=Dietzia kunjamensis subsp. schimae TaxID=498198 RepID=A0ABY1N2F1_9ACTN|nr:carboxylesterase family protein [Dietzia kunjamensis]SMO78191.1 para-nitrobenzyl esterase [Dietzia kunjamensis subsp. schimae]
MTDVDVTLSTGRLRGSDLGEVARFYGIPYAEDPVGDLRFAAPVRREPWPGVRDATRPAATAQRLRFDPDPAIPEPIVAGTDILHVDVWAPTEGAGHPVLVWIHGGGWESGSSHQPWFDGTAFARAGIVVVSVGYRLGVEGFTAFPDAPDNRGVRDWIMALEWVRDEIAAFGGDPGQVTVSGQSAGGGAVLCLLASPLAAGLFHRGIASSPAVLRSPAAQAPKGTTAAELAAGGRGAVDEFHRRLRRDNPFLMPFRPTVGDDTVPVPPLEGIGGGPGLDLPLLIGSTATEFEGVVRALPGPALVPGAAMILRSQELPTTGLRALARQSAGKSLRRAVGAVVDAATIHSTVVRAAETRMAAGAPTWVYDFRWAEGRGAVHCADLPFFWAVPEAANVRAYLGADAPPELVDAMHRSWVDFVRSGDPGSPPYEAPGRRVQVWDDPSAVVEDGLADVRAVWWPAGDS